MNKTLRAKPVSDEIGHGDHLQIVLLSEFDEIRHACHGAVFFHDFAYDAGRRELGDPREIHGGFGLPGAHQHASVACAKRKNVTRPGQIVGFGFRINGGQDRLCPIERGYSGGDIAAGFDRHAEGCPVWRRIAVIGDHQRNV